ncbi:uncharacterized protein [Pyxicephalus adspersus]|uniref:uncharacterized protein n=1 Tax=Pyxicephalus adspersus TaxID=30357 RepID=UPI003B5AE876
MIIFFFCSLLFFQIYAALDVFAPSPQRTLVANDTVLTCTFSVDKLPLDLNFLAILWTFQGKNILKYDYKGFFSQDPRMSLSVNSLEKGNASLRVSNVTISDGGIYTCAVIYSPEKKEKELSFEVLAKPLLSILGTKVRRNTENTLTCMATGFYPPDIAITWYRDGEILRNPLIGKPKLYNDGTYQVNSTVTITPTNDDNIFSCRIQHDSLQEPLQKDFKLIYEESSSSVITAVCVTLVLIVIAAVIGYLMWKRKARRKDMKVFTVLDIEGPTKLIAGEETSLCCRVIKCPEKISVTWLEKRGGEVNEIPKFGDGDKEEEERLLDTQYGIISCRDGTNYTSSLKFRPCVAKHKDVTFICRYSCGKEKKDKTFQCRVIHARPQLLQPVSRNLLVPGMLKYSVTLEKFYPRDIKLRWTHGVGESHEALSSKETFTEDPDGTYSVQTEVCIPEELLKDPEFKVRVSWEHKSLQTPGYKDLSIRDSEYAWNPVVEDIQTPSVFHDTPLTLQCNISEYFPDAITVTWLRRSEDQELCEDIDNTVSCTVIPKREADNTYSCTASLIIIPKLTIHQGAEYICRVEHPTLERPIEKKTARLVVKAIPQFVDPIEITMGDSSRVYFTLNLQKFYPEEIEIKWRYEDKDRNYEISYKNHFKHHKDLTYDVTSIGDTSMASFTDQFKVSVTWKHESMNVLETRTLTIRDLPWHPHVGEIVIPKLEENKKVSLTCTISRYFPDPVHVVWFRKEPGTDSDPIIIQLSDKDYKVTNQTTRQKDRTWSCLSSLTFTYLSSRDQAGEFICKVEHGSLENPIERRTGPIGLE